MTTQTIKTIIKDGEEYWRKSDVCKLFNRLQKEENRLQKEEKIFYSIEEIYK